MCSKIKKIKCLSLIVLMFFALFLSNELQAQSLRKTFKYLKEGNISEADIEIKEYKNKKKIANEDFILYNIAICLEVCNENYQNYDPYESLKKFKSTSLIDANKDEVDKFLAKYELSIEKVHEIIYQSIFSQAQKINTEQSYQNSLRVCDECSYKDEAIKLKETAAYNEAKSIRSVEGCKYFINSYSNSAYLPEINNLLYEYAFNHAKTKNDLNEIKLYIKEYKSEKNIYITSAEKTRDSLAFLLARNYNNLSEYDKYIHEYSRDNNPFYSLAINLRDSIAFYNLKRNYTEYKNFLDKYPHSIYTERLKAELPNLLFDKATQKANIYLLEQFIKEYPNDSRKDSLNIKLEGLYFEKLSKKPTKKKIESFKSRFPNSPNTKLIDSLVSNDLTKEKLIGNVKSVIISTCLFNRRRFDKTNDDSTSSIKYFNESGNLIESSFGNLERETYKYDDNENILEQCYYSDGTLTSRKTYKYNILEYLIEKCEYGKEGSLLFKEIYGENKNTLEKEEYDKEGRIKSKEVYYNNAEIEYSSYYQNGSIKYRRKYDTARNKYKEFDFYDSEGKLEIKYAEKFDAQGNKIEDAFFNDDGHPERIQTYKYNYMGKIIEEIDSERDYNRKKTYNYDANGNKIEEMEYGGAQTNPWRRKTYKYDEKRNKIEELEYDKEGKLISKTVYDEKGYIWAEEYNYLKNDYYKKSKVTLKYGKKRETTEIDILYSDGRMEKKYPIICNAKGQIIEKYDIDKNGTVWSKVIIKYDDKGNIIELSVLGQHNSLESKVIFKYDDKGNIIERYEYGYLINKKSYKMGHLVEEYADDSRIKGKLIYTYNANWEISYVTIYFDDGKVKKWYASRFNSKGFKIEECNIGNIYGGYLEIRDRVTYKYDNNGNWTEKIGYINYEDGVDFVITRKINYY